MRPTLVTVCSRSACSSGAGVHSAWAGRCAAQGDSRGGRCGGDGGGGGGGCCCYCSGGAGAVEGERRGPGAAGA